MKIYILFIFIFGLNLQAVFSQAGCNDLDITWDWLSDASYTNGAWGQVYGNIPLTNPFNSNNPDQNISDINLSNDYLPSQGWVLLARSFGCQNKVIQTWPYFILYNKYKSIIRVFMVDKDNASHSSGLANFYWDNTLSTTTSLLALNTSSTLLPNSLYNGTSCSSDDALYIIDKGPSFSVGSWFVTEFPVVFDVNTNNKMVSELRYGIQNQDKSTVAINGSFQFSTQSASAVGKNKPITGINDFDLAKQGVNQFLGKIPSTKSLQSVMNNVGTGLSDLGFIDGVAAEKDKITNAADELTKSSSTINQFLTGATDLTSALPNGLGIIGTVLDVFDGKSNSSASANSFTPTISTGSISLSGTITLNTYGTGFPLALPGTNHYQKDGITVNIEGLPLYDCPLGTVTLNNCPQVNLRTFQKLGSVQGILSLNYSYLSYQFNDYIQLALNYQSGLTIKNAYAQLVAEVMNNPQVTIPSGIGPYLAFPTQTGSVVNYNYLRDALNSNTYQLNGYINYPFKEGTGTGTKNHPNFKRMLIGTPYIPVSKFKNTSITVPKFNDSLSRGDNPNVPWVPFKVYLKLMLHLVPTDPTADQTPVLRIATYDLYSNLSLDETGTIGYDPTVDQLINQTAAMPTYPASALVCSTFPLNLSFNTPVNVSGSNYIVSARKKIVYKPGATVTASGNNYYQAHIEPGVVGVGASAPTQVYNTSCNCTAVPNQAWVQSLPAKPLSDRQTRNNNEELGVNNPISMNFEVYPSLTNGLFSINNNSSGTYDISVYDIAGNLLNETKHCLNKQNMDISTYPSGVYIVKILAQSSIITKKIVKN